MCHSRTLTHLLGQIWPFETGENHKAGNQICYVVPGLQTRHLLLLFFHSKIHFKHICKSWSLHHAVAWCLWERHQHCCYGAGSIWTFLKLQHRPFLARLCHGEMCPTFFSLLQHFFEVGTRSNSCHGPNLPARETCRYVALPLWRPSDLLSAGCPEEKWWCCSCFETGGRREENWKVTVDIKHLQELAASNTRFLRLTLVCKHSFSSI